VKLAAAIKPDEIKLFAGYDAKAKADPTGKYTWETRQNNNVTAFTLTVELKDGKPAGTLETKRGNADAVSTPIADAAMDGNKLAFAVKTKQMNRDVEQTYIGVVTDTGVGGWVMADNGKTPNDAAWTAKKAK
jgi:hypothetical protein